MELVIAIALIALLTYFIYRHRKKIVLQKILYPLLYVVLYRTKWGLGFMDRTAKKHPRFWKWVGYIGIVIGYIGMVFISYLLIENVINLFTSPEQAAGAGLVLPIKAKGVFYVPFFYWIISIFFIAVVHEAAHGIIARVHKIKIKSSGAAFLGVVVPLIPMAFVEPDEKAIVKRPAKEQLAVYGAGPLSNMFFGIVFLLLFIHAIAPGMSAMTYSQGLEYAVIANESSPAYTQGVVGSAMITGIDGQDVRTVDAFKVALDGKRPNEQIRIRTNETEHSITLGSNPDNKSKAYIGIQLIGEQREFKERYIDAVGQWTLEAALWFSGLVMWLAILNFGIGLFNLAPLAITDGGRMLLVALEKKFHKKKARQWWKYISLVFVAVLIIIIVFGFVRGLGM